MSSERIAELEAELAVLKSRLERVERRVPQDGEIFKVDEDKRLVTAFAYVARDKNGNQVVDWSGDVVSDADNLEKAAHDFILKSRAADLNHNRTPVGEVVESFVFTPDKIEKLGVPEGILPACGWIVTMRVNDDAVWARVKSGELKALSVGGRGARTPIG